MANTFRAIAPMQRLSLRRRLLSRPDTTARLVDAIEAATVVPAHIDAGFVAQATKIGELYSSLAKEAFKPVENAVTKMYNGKS